MSKYSQAVIDDLLQHLDALDVLELIDYHPETIQRSGDIVRSWCPLCQNRSGRYLTVHLRSRQFESTPPGGPDQSGTLIDLFARCRRINYEEAVELLADEFGVLLVEGDAADWIRKAVDEAEEMLLKAKELIADEEGRQRLQQDAEKRLRRVLEHDRKNLKAMRLFYGLATRHHDELALMNAAQRLIELETSAGNGEAIAEIAAEYLERYPNDLATRKNIAEALIKTGMVEAAVGELMALADIAEQHDQPEEALAAYNRVQEVGSQLVDVHPMIMGLLISQGHGEEAGRQVQRRIEILRREKRFKEAFDEALQKIDFVPEDNEARVQAIEIAVQAGLDEAVLERCMTLVDEMMEGGHHKEAGEALSYLSAELPDNAVIVEALTTTYERLGEGDLVKDLRLRLVDLHRRAGDNESALLMLEKMLQEYKDDVHVLKSMVEMQLQGDGDVSLAKEMLRKIAETHAQRSEFGEALATHQRILTLDPTNLDSAEASIDFMFQLGKKGEALALAEALSFRVRDKNTDSRMAKLLEGVIRRSPDFIAGMFLLASLYTRNGNHRRGEDLMSNLVRKATTAGFLPKAEEIGLKLLKEHPESSDLLELAAAFYQASDQRDKASRRYEELANRLQKSDKTTDYRRILEKLIALRPGDHGVLARLSDFCTEQGDEAGVVAAAEKQLAVFETEKDWPAVVEQANQILELQANHTAALRHLVTAHEELGHSEQALKARQELAGLLHGTARVEEEAAVLKELLRNNPNQPESLERLISLLAEAGQEKELVEWVNQYLELHKAHPEKGLKLLRDLVKDKPRAAELRLSLARLYRTAGRSDDMVSEMQSVIDVYTESDRAEEAVRLYTEALESAPESLSTRSGLISLLRNQARNTESVEHSLVLARYLEKARKLQEADAIYRGLYDLEPENEAIYRAHAALLRQMDSVAEAARRLRELATIFKKQERTEKAVSVLTELLEADPRNQEVRRDIIALKRDGGKPKQAVEELAALAKILEEEGDAEGMIAARREAVSILPDSVDLRIRLIERLEESGRISEAQSEALELAQVYSRAKNYDKGLAILQNVLEAEPHNIHARRGRAMIYDAMGDEKRALAEYREMQTHLDKFSAPAAPQPAVAVQEDDNYPQLEIMPDYDFETFVVGSKNNFAFATAKAVAEHPGSARNPLFLYSDVGLGKTHLLHAIANQLKGANPNVRILYTSTEYFTSELLDAIQNNSVTAFRNRHQHLDVLLLDDVQFLAGKERSQEEFFHIFNMLYQKQKQIVVTSDRPPKDIAHLNMRLRSRFGQGVIVDIQPPDQELRLAILKAENQRSNVGVPEAVLAVLAARVSSNVRELKGAYNQLITQHEIGGRPLTEETANAIVDKFFAA